MECTTQSPLRRRGTKLFHIVDILGQGKRGNPSERMVCGKMTEVGEKLQESVGYDRNKS